MSSSTSSSESLRRFVATVSLFALVYLAVSVAWNQAAVRLTRPRIASRILVAGDSHVMTALNPEILGSAANVAQGAEPLFVTYWKLRALDFETATEEDIAAIIGNSSWTNLWCDNCACGSKEAVTLFTDDQPYGWSTRLCDECLRAALDMQSND